MLRVRQVQRAHGRGELFAGDVADPQPMGAHPLHMLRPRIDERHIVPGLSHMCAGIATDRTRPHDGDSRLFHIRFLPQSRPLSYA